MKVTKVITVTIFLSMAVIVCGAQAQNLVTNPDFADGQNGWGFYAGNSAGSWMVQPDGGVADNGPCAFVEITATSADGWYTPNLYTSAYVALSGNTEHTCSFWARTEAGADKDVTLTVQRGADPWNRFTQASFTIDGEWNEYSMTWTQTETLNNAWLMIHTPGSDARVAPGKLWLDHVRVYQGEYVDDEVSQAIAAGTRPTGKLATAWGHVKSL